MTLDDVYGVRCGRRRDRPLQQCVFARFDELSRLVVSNEILGGNFLLFPDGDAAIVWRTFGDGQFACIGWSPAGHGESYEVVVDRSRNHSA